MNIAKTNKSELPSEIIGILKSTTISEDSNEATFST